MVSVAELKRIIEALPLEKSAVSVVAPRLAAFDPPQFAALLRELARDNHAFRCALTLAPTTCLVNPTAVPCAYVSQVEAVSVLAAQPLPLSLA